MKTHVIDGKNFVKVDRKANVGDLVIITNDRAFQKQHNGKIGKVEFVYGGSISVNIGEEIDYYPHVFNGEYVVIEPIETVDESQASPEVIELLANLARRVTSLEQQLRDTQRNVETWAEENENLKHLAESNEQDIAMLDERTQVIYAIKKFYEGGRR